MNPGIPFVDIKSHCDLPHLHVSLLQDGGVLTEELFEREYFQRKDQQLNQENGRNMLLVRKKAVRKLSNDTLNKRTCCCDRLITSIHICNERDQGGGDASTVTKSGHRQACFTKQK